MQTQNETQTHNWLGEVEVATKLIVTHDKEGRKKTVRATFTHIVLTHKTRGEGIRFNVTHRLIRNRHQQIIGASSSITDAREEQFGATGTSGLFGTREPQKAGRRKSLTPLEWVSEVRRLVGEGEARALILEAGCFVSKAG
jgi:hypothetical protein